MSLACAYALVHCRCLHCRMALRAPVAKGQPSNDNPVDVIFWMTAIVPNALDGRITSTSHSIDCVIRTVDVNHNSASAFAAQYALRHFGGRPASKRGRFGRRLASQNESFRSRPAFKKTRPYRTDRQPDHQERNSGRDRPHLYPLQTPLRNSKSNLFLSC